MSERIFFHLDENVAQMIETLALIYEVMTPEEMVGRVEFV